MFKDDAWLRPALIIALGALAAALLVREVTEYPSVPSTWTSFVVTMTIVAVSAVVRLLLALFSLWRAKVERPSLHLLTLAPHALKEQSVIVGGIAIVGLLLFSVTFLKSMIPQLVGFWADDFLAAIDTAFSINGEGLARYFHLWLPALGLFYGLWHLVDMGGIVWVIHWRVDRGRFVLSYMLTWAIGMAVAYVFSSAGPLFTDRYDLSIAPASVRTPAEMLWANYLSRGALLGGGISAFPSLHVAIATWFAIVLANRGMLWLGIAYVAAIYACSVILGWHYGLDGLGGILVALAADRMAVRLNRPRQPALQPPLHPARSSGSA